MKYGVYKVMYRENVRWYTRPVGEEELVDFPYAFEGEDARRRACEKAMELNEREGRVALAA
ncbi:MAG: hypothetical protein ACE5Q6_18695 [Dehalococcoidia bacterium]